MFIYSDSEVCRSTLDFPRCSISIVYLLSDYNLLLSSYNSFTLFDITQHRSCMIQALTTTKKLV